MMNAAFVLQRVFREVFDDEDMIVTPETRREDVEGWDSVAQVKLVLVVEEEFGVRFTEDEVSSMQTVGGFLNALQLRKGDAA